MKDFKDVIILVLISVVAGVSLSIVYSSTKERIAEVKRQELQMALKKVLPSMQDDHETSEFSFENQVIPIYWMENNGKLIGAVLKIQTNEGFGGKITFLLGVDSSGKITGFYLLEQKETPGLGTKAADKKFWGQFVGKALSNFKFKVQKDKGDVEAITAATITSRAISNAIDKGLRAFQSFLKSRRAA